MKKVNATNIIKVIFTVMFLAFVVGTIVFSNHLSNTDATNNVITNIGSVIHDACSFVGHSY